MIPDFEDQDRKHSNNLRRLLLQTLLDHRLRRASLRAVGVRLSNSPHQKNWLRCRPECFGNTPHQKEHSFPRSSQEYIDYYLSRFGRRMDNRLL
jgi:hypothetical protein